MAFLIPDNLKSRQDVPASVRRVASAFQVGLDESAVVWYEPLYDPSGQKPHLVVLLPDRGVVILEVLEVKAEGFLGILRGQLRLERDGVEIEVANPLVRATKLADVLRTRVKTEPRLRDLKIPVAAGAAFPSLSPDEAGKKGVDKALRLELCLFKSDVDAAIEGKGEDILLRAFGRMIGPPLEQPIEGEKEKILRGLIQPETVIDRVASTSKGVQLTIFRPPEGVGEVVRVMDRQQEAMAKSLGDGHRIIRGVAGSGKTLILVYRARLLAQLFQNERFLVTCYTRSLAGQLRAMLLEHQNVDVMHLDRLMADTIRAAKMRHPGYEDDDSGEKVAQAALDALKRGYGPRYRAVLLDEAQDFGTNALRFTVGLLKSASQDMVIVADAAQNIFRRKFSWKDAGIQAQGRTRLLRVNYRNTKEILQFASQFLLAGSTLHPEEVPDFEDENAVIPPQSAARSGPHPVLRIARDATREVLESINQVKAWAQGSPGPRTIAVLYASRSDGHFQKAETLRKELTSARVPIFWLNDPKDPNAKDKIAETQAPVVLSTIQSSKGLEFPYVVLCGIWREGDDVEANRKLAYVGMTRATDYLTVVTREGHPLVEDLRRAAL